MTEPRAKGADERTRSDRVSEPRVEYLLRFERLLSSVSSTLIAASSAEMPARIEEALCVVVEFFGVDRATLGERSLDGRDIVSRVVYGRPGLPPPLPLGTRLGAVGPWYAREIVDGRVVRVSRVSELPPEAGAERELALRLGIKAHLAVPILMGGECRYLMGLNSFTSEVDWPADLIPRVRILAEMIAHAHERARAERELERLYRAAQEAIQIRDDFITIASHELRTPCTSLQLAVQAVSRERVRKPEAVSDVIRRSLGTIARQIANLNLLVDRLLDVSLIAEGHLQIVRSEVDLADVARAAVAHLQEPLVVCRSTLTVDAPTPVVGSWDRVRLEQVATNLIANAIKFGMKEPIEVIVRADGDAATLVVRDHGIGIPPAEQARIFGRFERAVPQEHFGGFGLGLYISKAIIDAHRGSIRVMSCPAEGSTFVVRLPFHCEPPVVR